MNGVLEVRYVHAGFRPQADALAHAHFGDTLLFSGRMNDQDLDVWVQGKVAIVVLDHDYREIAYDSHFGAMMPDAVRLFIADGRAVHLQTNAFLVCYGEYRREHPLLPPWLRALLVGLPETHPA